jgi:RNA polymerase sigma-70 factor (ECF subfamily)
VGIDAAAERQIGERLDAGDLEGAASSIVRAYGPQLLGYLRAILPAEAAEEAFAVFCEFLWVGLPAFRREAAALTWTYHLAWGAARRVLEDPYRRRAEVLTSGVASALVAQARTTTAAHLKAETAKQLEALRAELDLEEQTLLVLRIDRDLSWSEIARAMDDDESAAVQARLRKRYERLVEKIRRLARDRGLLPKT